MTLEPNAWPQPKEEVKGEKNVKCIKVFNVRPDPQMKEGRDGFKEKNKERERERAQEIDRLIRLVLAVLSLRATVGSLHEN